MRIQLKTCIGNADIFLFFLFSENLIERVKREILLRITGGAEARANSWPWQVNHHEYDDQSFATTNLQN